MGLIDIGKGISDGIKSVSDVASKAIDKIPDENLRRELEADFQKAAKKLVNSAHKVDSTSDSWLSRNIRPIGLIWLMIIDTAIVVAFLIAFFKNLEVENLLMLFTMFGTINGMAFGFYYGGKGLQRLAEAFNKNKK